MARKELNSHTIPCNASRITSPPDAPSFTQLAYLPIREVYYFSMDAGIKASRPSGPLASQNDIQSWLRLILKKLTP